MRIIETKVYTFDELNDRAKEKAREWFRRDVFTNSCDWDATFDGAVECFHILGVEVAQRKWTNQHGHSGNEPKIFFSGFWSQGDGASFEGTYRYAKGARQAIRQHAPKDTELHRIADALQKIQARYFYRLTASMENRDRYCHSRAMTVNVDYFGDDSRSIVDAESEITDCMRDLADWIYSQLQKEYEYQTSDECVDENIRINGYEFTEDGERA